MMISAPGRPKSIFADPEFLLPHGALQGLWALKLAPG
jgi:hypothetical protein